MKKPSSAGSERKRTLAVAAIVFFAISAAVLGASYSKFGVRARTRGGGGKSVVGLALPTISKINAKE
jgi:hypothetical protein